MDSCWQSPWLRKSRARLHSSRTCHSHGHTNLRQTGQRGHSTAFARQGFGVRVTSRLTHVTGQLHEISEQPMYLGPPKTAESARTISLPPHVVDLLAHHLDSQTHQYDLTPVLR